MRREFGLLDELESYTVGPYKIAPLDNARETLLDFKRSDVLEGDWIDPSSDSELRLGPRGTSSNASLFFRLPRTHVVEGVGEWAGGGAQADREIEFLVTYLGFLKGVRLVPEPWTYVSRVPIEVGSLVGFRCAPPAVERLLRLGLAFWASRDGSSSQKLVFAAIHWYLLAQCFQHEYEQFAAHYTVIDICFRILRTSNLIKTEGTHATRAQRLASELGLATPAWAVVGAGARESAVSTVRNALVHEGLYGGKPVGFGFPEGEFDIDLAPFNSRLLLALLGVRDNFTASRVTAQVWHFSQ